MNQPLNSVFCMKFFNVPPYSFLDQNMALMFRHLTRLSLLEKTQNQNLIIRVSKNSKTESWLRYFHVFSYYFLVLQTFPHKGHLENWSSKIQALVEFLTFAQLILHQQPWWANCLPCFLIVVYNMAETGKAGHLFQNFTRACLCWCILKMILTQFFFSSFERNF